MGNNQSSKKNRQVIMEPSLENILEKQHRECEKRCRELLQAEAQSLSNQGNTISVSGAAAVSLENLNGHQSVLYPNLSQASTPEQSSDFAVNNLQSINVTDNNSLQINSYSSCSAQNFNVDHNVMQRVTPSAPPLPFSCSLTNENRTKCSTNNIISNVFNCRTCGNELGLIIFECGDGHICCQKCKYTGGICRVSNCGKMINDISNKALEAYMADLKLAVEKLRNKPGASNGRVYIQRKQRNINCPNHFNGCILHFPFTEMDIHLKECPFNNMSCPLASIFGQCSWQGIINQLCSHVSECHPEHVTDVNTEMTLYIKNNNRNVYLVNLGNYKFLIHVKVDVEVQVIYMVVQHLGSRISARKWCYEFHVYKKMKPRRNYEYTDVCVSNTAAMEDIFTDNKCAVIPLNYAKTFHDKFWINYKFFIKKVEVKKV